MQHSQLTIGPYKTLGVCASVADISDSLTHKSAKNGTIYSLPGGHSVQQDNTDEVRLYFVSAQTPNEDESGSVATPLNFSSSMAFQNVSAPIADVFIIYLDETVSGDIGNADHAIEFVLDWCVQTLESTVDAGKISTQRLEEDHSFAILDNSKDVRSGGYSVYISTHCSLQRYLQQLLEGKASGSVTVTADSDIFQAFYTPIYVSKVRAGVAPIDGIKAILDNVAMSMTNEVRANDPKSAATLWHQYRASSDGTDCLGLRIGLACLHGNMFAVFHLDGSTATRISWIPGRSLAELDSLEIVEFGSTSCLGL
jgi:hypothetical protein